MYLDIITESVVSAMTDIDSYLLEKKYLAESNIIDVVTGALANEISCQVKIHYQDRDNSFDTHLIKPEISSTGVIELSFINGHYDLITKNRNTVKQEVITSTTTSFDTATSSHGVQSSEPISDNPVASEVCEFVDDMEQDSGEGSERDTEHDVDSDPGSDFYQYSDGDSNESSFETSTTTKYILPLQRIWALVRGLG